MKFAVAIFLCLVSLINAQAPRGGGGRGDLPEEFTPDGPRHDGPRQDGLNPDGPKSDGPRPDGLKPDSPRQDGPRQDGPRPGPRPNIPGLSFSAWNQTLDGQDVGQIGFANENESVVIVRSGDRWHGVETLYDFSGPSVVVVVRVGPGCVVIPADASVTNYSAAAAAVNGRNGTTIGAPAGSVQLNATAGTNSSASSDAITRFCRGRQPVDAVLARADFPTAGSEPAGQKVLSFVTLDTSVQLLVAPLSGRPKGRPGPGGRHGGRGGPGRG